MISADSSPEPKDSNDAGISHVHQPSETTARHGPRRSRHAQLRESTAPAEAARPDSRIPEGLQQLAGLSAETDDVAVD